MVREDELRVVGTIRAIDLHPVVSRIKDVPSRQIAKIELDVEWAVDGDGAEIDITNLQGVCFQGPAELMPRFHLGDRVQIVTGSPSRIHIANIKTAPLS